MQAAIDACELMGRRKFMDQMVEDAVNQVHAGADENEVSTLKDYMQYASTIDCQPAYLGGRSNGWRVLHTEVPQQSGLLYDLVTYFKGSDATDSLKRTVPAFVTEEDISNDQAVSRLRALEAMRKMRRKGISKKMGGNKRKKHLDKLRSMYGMKGETPEPSSAESSHPNTRPAKTPEQVRAEYDEELNAPRSAKTPAQIRAEYDQLLNGPHEIRAEYDRELEALPTPVSSLLNHDGVIANGPGMAGFVIEDEEDDETLFQWSQTLPLDELEM